MSDFAAGVIPRIETARLVMRGWREEDLDSYAAMVADAEVTHFVGGVITRADAWRGMAAMLGHWALRGYGTWAVERKSDGELVGRIGLLNPEGWPGLEVIWTLARPFWGMGYAREAAAASMRFGFEHTSEARLISLIHAENHASAAVAQRIGEVKRSQTTITLFGKHHDVDVWEIRREEWLAKNS